MEIELRMLNVGDIFYTPRDGIRAEVKDIDKDSGMVVISATDFDRVIQQPGTARVDVIDEELAAKHFRNYPDVVSIPESAYPHKILSSCKLKDLEPGEVFQTGHTNVYGELTTCRVQAVGAYRVRVVIVFDSSNVDSQAVAWLSRDIDVFIKDEDGDTDMFSGLLESQDENLVETPAVEEEEEEVVEEEVVVEAAVNDEEDVIEVVVEEEEDVVEILGHIPEVVEIVTESMEVEREIAEVEAQIPAPSEYTRVERIINDLKAEGKRVSASAVIKQILLEIRPAPRERIGYVIEELKVGLPEDMIPKNLSSYVSLIKHNMTKAGEL